MSFIGSSSGHLERQPQVVWLPCFVAPPMLARASRLHNSNALGLLNCHALREITRQVHIRTVHHRHMVREQL